MNNDSQKKELIKKILEIIDFDGDDNEHQKKMSELEDLCIDPHVSDYIYSKEYEHLTPEQIVDKVLEYKPMILPVHKDSKLEK